MATLTGQAKERDKARRFWHFLSALLEVQNREVRALSRGMETLNGVTNQELLFMI